MLKKAVVEAATPIEFLIDEADPDELIVCTSISGLDPSDVELFTGEFAQRGGYYQGRRSGRRFPIFNFKINPNYALGIDASDARDILYRTFLEPQADTDGVQVRLVDDHWPDRYFIGYTEKPKAEIFAKQPTAQMAMVCVDPYLKSVDETSASNPTGWLSVPLNYDGSADTGIDLTLKVVANTSTVVVQNNSTTMTLNGAFLTGDILEINTNQGSRAVKLNGVDIMALLTAGDWIALTQADNFLRSFGDLGAGDGKVVVTDYLYRSEWWGI